MQVLYVLGFIVVLFVLISELLPQRFASLALGVGVADALTNAFDPRSHLITLRGLGSPVDFIGNGLQHIHQRPEIGSGSAFDGRYSDFLDRLKPGLQNRAEQVGFCFGGTEAT